MTFTIEQVLTLLGMIGGLVSFWVGFSSRIAKLEVHVETLKKDVERFWDNIAKDAARILHHPDPHAWELDELLEQFRDAAHGGQAMLPVDIDRLRAKLWRKIEDVTTDRGERFTASNMLRAVEALYPEHRGANQFGG